MLRETSILLVLTMACLPSTVDAAASDVSPALRQRAEAPCRDDALRICADALPDEAAVVACMRPKRASLTAPCRKVFDEIEHAIGR